MLSPDHPISWIDPTICRPDGGIEEDDETKSQPDATMLSSNVGCSRPNASCLLPHVTSADPIIGCGPKYVRPDCDPAVLCYFRFNKSIDFLEVDILDLACWLVFRNRHFP